MATGSRLGQSLARCGWRRSRASGGPSLWPGVDGAGNREYQFAAVAAGAWTSCRGWVLMASPLASWEEGGGGTGPVRLDSHPRRMWCDLPRVHGTGGREQSGARSQPAGASLDIGKQRSPIKRRLLCRLRRSHYTADASLMHSKEPAKFCRKSRKLLPDNRLKSPRQMLQLPPNREPVSYSGHDHSVSQPRHTSLHYRSVQRPVG